MPRERISGEQRLGRRLLERVAANLAGVVVIASLSGWPVGARAADIPAGADQTKIKNWADPRPEAWSKKYPPLGPVTLGDGSLKRLQHAGTIKICAATVSPPYLSTDPKTGKIVGSDYDMARHAMDMLGIKNIDYVNLDFGSLISGLQASRCDIVMNSLIIRSDRAKAPGVRFTTPYALIFDELVVRKDSPYQMLKDMKGQKIASVAGSSDADTLQAAINGAGGGITIVTFAGSNECYLSVVEKLTAGCMYDDGSTAGALKQFTALRATDELFRYRPTGNYSNEAQESPYVFGAAAAITRSADNDLNRALSIAINDMVADGTQKRILEKWGMWHNGEEKMVRPGS